jgi:2-(1,2-epoxy-1,2-dihydrophenyl)acetyl-CoA isomerase
VPDQADIVETCEDGVVTLLLDRPAQLNAVTAPMFESLLERCERIAGDESVGALVLAGAGRAFCAGGDVKEMADRAPEAPQAAVATLRRRMEIARLLHEMPKPTIAKVQGPAAGAGVCLALACDLRIAGPGASFTLAFGRVGYSGDYGGSYFLPRLVGAAKARELYFTSAKLGAQEALDLGIVNRVVTAEALDAEVAQLAASLASGPRVALAQMKRNLNAADEGTLADVLDIEAEGQIRCRFTEDHREAARAFLERRAPRFRGR